MTPGAAARFADLPEIEVDTFRSAAIWTIERRRRVHLVVDSPEVAERALVLLRDRLGRAAADELVRITVRGGA